MQMTAVIRSLNTKIADHGRGADLVERGRLDDPGLRYPDLGAVVAKELGRLESTVPDYVSLYTSTEGRRKGTSGFLGARYAPLFLAENMSPPNSALHEKLTTVEHQDRAALRDLLSKRFAAEHRSSTVGSQNSAYQRVQGMMASAGLFNIEQESAEVRARYGPTQFGEQCLIARRLVEAGVPFVKVARAWWDSHGQNFETHQEMVPELDRVMSALLLSVLLHLGIYGGVRVAKRYDLHFQELPKWVKKLLPAAAEPTPEQRLAAEQERAKKAMEERVLDLTFVEVDASQHRLAGRVRFVEPANGERGGGAQGLICLQPWPWLRPPCGAPLPRALIHARRRRR